MRLTHTPYGRPHAVDMKYTSVSPSGFKAEIGLYYHCNLF